jgi:hypothetical protein
VAAVEELVEVEQVPLVDLELDNYQQQQQWQLVLVVEVVEHLIMDLVVEQDQHHL